MLFGDPGQLLGNDLKLSENFVVFDRVSTKGHLLLWLYINPTTVLHNPLKKVTMLANKILYIYIAHNLHDCYCYP